MSFAKLDVLLSPEEFEALPGRDLSTTGCVVFAVLRAPSTMTVALPENATACESEPQSRAAWISTWATHRAR